MRTEEELEQIDTWFQNLPDDIKTIRGEEEEELFSGKDAAKYACEMLRSPEGSIFEGVELRIALAFIENHIRTPKGIDKIVDAHVKWHTATESQRPQPFPSEHEQPSRFSIEIVNLYIQLTNRCINIITEEINHYENHPTEKHILSSNAEKNLEKLQRFLKISDQVRVIGWLDKDNSQPELFFEIDMPKTGTQTLSGFEAKDALAEIYPNKNLGRAYFHTCHAVSCYEHRMEYNLEQVINHLSSCSIYLSSYRQEQANQLRQPPPTPIITSGTNLPTLTK
jgi:hypothetical protein